MAEKNEPGINWAATFSRPGPGGTVNVVYCYAFARGGSNWGDICSRCGVREGDHIAEADDRATSVSRESEGGE